MEANVLDMKGKKIETVELPVEIFDAPVNVDMMHQAFVRQLANQRLGRHSTKAEARFPAVGENPGARKGPVEPDRDLSELLSGLVVARSLLQNHALTTKKCPRK